MEKLEELEKRRDKINKAIVYQRKRLYKKEEKKRNHNIFLAFGLLNQDEKLFSKEELKSFTDNQVIQRMNNFEIKSKT